MSAKVEIDSIWNFKGDKVFIVATSDTEICFRYEKDNRFDQEIVSTWDRVAKPWKDETTYSTLLDWVDKLNAKLDDTRAGQMRLFTYAEVDVLKKILLDSATKIDKLEREKAL